MRKFLPIAIIPTCIAKHHTYARAHDLYAIIIILYAASNLRRIPVVILLRMIAIENINADYIDSVSLSHRYILMNKAYNLCTNCIL